MACSQIILYAIITLIAAFYPVTSLQCWDCKSSINPACSDPFLRHPFATLNCTASPRYAQVKAEYPNMTTPMCRKVIETVEGQIHVIRSCGYLEDPKSFGVAKCTTKSKSQGMLIESCNCYTDECNGDASLTASLKSTIILSLCGLTFITATGCL